MELNLKEIEEFLNERYKRYGLDELNESKKILNMKDIDRDKYDVRQNKAKNYFKQYNLPILDDHIKKLNSIVKKNNTKIVYKRDKNEYDIIIKPSGLFYTGYGFAIEIIRSSKENRVKNYLINPKDLKKHFLSNGSPDSEFIDYLLDFDAEEINVNGNFLTFTNDSIRKEWQSEYYKYSSLENEDLNKVKEYLKKITGISDIGCSGKLEGYILKVKDFKNNAHSSLGKDEVILRSHINNAEVKKIGDVYWIDLSAVKKHIDNISSIC